MALSPRPSLLRMRSVYVLFRALLSLLLRPIRSFSCVLVTVLAPVQYLPPYAASLTEARKLTKVTVVAVWRFILGIPVTGSSPFAALNSEGHRCNCFPTTFQ